MEMKTILETEERIAQDRCGLSAEERAYRRGCLQAIQFLQSHCVVVGVVIRGGSISDWEQALIGGRDSTDPAYLGKYLDEIVKVVQHLKELRTWDEDPRREHR